MTSIEIKSGPPGFALRPDGIRAPRPTPLEWARRRRATKVEKRADAVRDRAMGRVERLGRGWHLIEASALGLGARDAFVAIGPGGVFAVTVKSQGRSPVRLSGDVIQINGQRLDYLAEARRFADSIAAAFSRTAGTQIPVTPVLALAGTGLLTLYGLPKGAVVMPYRELANLLGSYGARIAPRTVEKLASIARHPATASDLRLERRIPMQRGPSLSGAADKTARRR